MSVRGAKPRKPKAPAEPDNKAQSARFIEAAKSLGLDESGKDFEKAMGALLTPKPKPKK